MAGLIGLIERLAAAGGIVTGCGSLALVVLALTVLIVVAQPAVRRARISPGREPAQRPTARRAG